MTLATFPLPPSHPPGWSSTPDSESHRAEYRQSRASTNSSFFSHESHGPQTPRADSGLSLVICSDENEYHSEGGNKAGWWADVSPSLPSRNADDQLTPRVPQSGHNPDEDVCLDDSPTLPHIPLSLLKDFPRPPNLAPHHPYAHPSSSRRSESTETLHANSSPRRAPPPSSAPPERPLPLDPEKLAEVNRALRDLGLQELASASVLTPSQSPRNSAGSQVPRGITPSYPSSQALPSPYVSDTASLKSSTSLQSIYSAAPSIPSRSSSRRTPQISSRASSLKLIRSPYGIPTDPSPSLIPYPRSSSALSGLSRLTTSSDSWSSAGGSYRSPRSSYRNSSIRSIHSVKLPSIFELPRDLDLVPSGEWALRQASPYRIYGASKSTPDLNEGRDMSLRQKLKHRKYIGGSPPLDGTSFIDLSASSGRWRPSRRRSGGDTAGLSLERRLSNLKSLLLSADLPSRRSSFVNPEQDNFSPVADTPPQLDYHEPEEREESLLDNVRALVEAKGWDWPAPPDFSTPTPGYGDTPEETVANHSSENTPEMPYCSPQPTVSSLAPPSSDTPPQEPITPSQTHASTLCSTGSLPHTRSTPRSSTKSGEGSAASTRRPSRAPPVAMDLSEEIDALDQADAERIAEEEKAKAIANGTYVDLSAPRAKAIGFSAPAALSTEESVPSIQKAKMKKEAAMPPENKGGLKFMKAFKKGSK